MRRKTEARFLAGIALAALICAAARAETPAETEVRARSRAVAAAEGRLDADAVAPFWADDAVVPLRRRSALWWAATRSTRCTPPRSRS
jgi:hypothetical protein